MLACDGFLFLSSESLTETQCSQLQIKDEEKGSNQMREQSLEPSCPLDSMSSLTMWTVLFEIWVKAARDTLFLHLRLRQWNLCPNAWCVIYQHWLGKLCTLLESVQVPKMEDAARLRSQRTQKHFAQVQMRSDQKQNCVWKDCYLLWSQISTNQSSSFLFLCGKIFHYMYRLKAHVQTHTV